MQGQNWLETEHYYEPEAQLRADVNQQSVSKQETLWRDTHGDVWDCEGEAMAGFDSYVEQLWGHRYT